MSGNGLKGKGEGGGGFTLWRQRQALWWSVPNRPQHYAFGHCNADPLADRSGSRERDSESMLTVETLPTTWQPAMPGKLPEECGLARCTRWTSCERSSALNAMCAHGLSKMPRQKE